VVIDIAHSVTETPGAVEVEEDDPPESKAMGYEEGVGLLELFLAGELLQGCFHIARIATERRAVWQLNRTPERRRRGLRPLPLTAPSGARQGGEGVPAQTWRLTELLSDCWKIGLAKPAWVSSSRNGSAAPSTAAPRPTGRSSAKVPFVCAWGRYRGPATK